jgi:hypothetical protein
VAPNKRRSQIFAEGLQWVELRRTKSLWPAALSRR